MPVVLDAITPTETDRAFATANHQMLAGLDGTARLHLHGDTTDIVLPPAVMRVLREAMTYFEAGQSVSVVPRPTEVSTIQAANLLGVSRPHLVKLLDAGHIAYRRVGARHRRIALADLLRYQGENKAKRLDVLAELQAQAQELGMGY